MAQKQESARKQMEANRTVEQELPEEKFLDLCTRDARKEYNGYDDYMKSSVRKLAYEAIEQPDRFKGRGNPKSVVRRGKAPVEFQDVYQAGDQIIERNIDVKNRLIVHYAKNGTIKVLKCKGHLGNDDGGKSNHVGSRKK